MVFEHQICLLLFLIAFHTWSKMPWVINIQVNCANFNGSLSIHLKVFECKWMIICYKFLIRRHLQRILTVFTLIKTWSCCSQSSNAVDYLLSSWHWLARVFQAAKRHISGPNSSCCSSMNVLTWALVRHKRWIMRQRVIDNLWTCKCSFIIFLGCIRQWHFNFVCHWNDVVFICDRLILSNSEEHDTFLHALLQELILFFLEDLFVIFKRRRLKC